MIDLFSIFTKGGILLFKSAKEEKKIEVVNELIKNVLMESRESGNNTILANYKLHWRFSNELDLVFVVSCYYHFRSFIKRFLNLIMLMLYLTLFRPNL